MTTLLDVTLREAGFINGYCFPLAAIEAIVAALDGAGIDVIEVGYYRPGQPDATGATCGPKYLETVAAPTRRAAVAVMVHPRDVPLDAYAALARAGVSIVRFALAPHDFDELTAHADAALSAGLWRLTIDGRTVARIADTFRTWKFRATQIMAEGDLPFGRASCISPARGWTFGGDGPQPAKTNFGSNWWSVG